MCSLCLYVQSVTEFRGDAGRCAQVGTATVEGGIPDGFLGLDIGPQTVSAIQPVIARAKTVVWNGSVRGGGGSSVGTEPAGPPHRPTQSQ